MQTRLKSIGELTECLNSYGHIAITCWTMYYMINPSRQNTMTAFRCLG